MLCSPTDPVLSPRGGFPHSSIGKESDWNAVDPGLRRSPGEGNGYPLQYSSLENSMGCMYSPWIAKSRTRRSNFDFHFSLWAA